MTVRYQVTNQAWTPVGVTPCLVQAIGGAMRLVFAPSLPTDPEADFHELSNKGEFFVDLAGLNAYVKLNTSSQSNALQYGIVAVTTGFVSTSSTSRVETLWTDDTNAYFIRVDSGGTIAWTDPSGNAASAPGTGARPAAGTSAIVDSSRYQATASGTGFSSGDYLSHIVTSDPVTGAVIGHFWLNVTTEIKLASAPASANITPISPLPAGAATDTSVQAVKTALGSPLQANGVVSVSNFPATQPVSAAALPLPSGAATSAAQGGVADAAATNSTGSWSIVALLKGLLAALLGTLKVGGTSARAFASFVRPANTTAYAVGQLVANATTAASVAPIALTAARVAAGTGTITCVKLSKSNTSLTNAAFRAHFYRNAPTASNGDGAAWLTTASIYLGYADITMDKAFSDEASGTGVPKDAAGNPRTIVFDTAAGSQSIYALIEARAAYTPASAETFTLTAEILQD